MDIEFTMTYKVKEGFIYDYNCVYFSPKDDALAVELKGTENTLFNPNSHSGEIIIWICLRFVFLLGNLYYLEARSIEK